MSEIVEAFVVRLEEASIETPGATEDVKTCYDRLCLASERICADTNCSTSYEKCLQLAAFPVICTIGREGPCLALSVFGAIPRPSRIIQAPFGLDWCILIDRNIGEPAMMQTRRKLVCGFRR